MIAALLLIRFQNMFINMFSICNHLTVRLLVSLLSCRSQPNLPRLLYQCLEHEENVTTSKSCLIKVPLAILGDILPFFSPRIHSQRLLIESSFDSSKSHLRISYSITSSYLFILRYNLLIFPCQISSAQA